MSRPLGPFTYTAQAWDGETLLSSIDGLSFDAARHVAQCVGLTGHTGRIMCAKHDYCEVYAPDGTTRCGTFAQTTLVYGSQS